MRDQFWWFLLWLCGAGFGFILGIMFMIWQLGWWS